MTIYKRIKASTVALALLNEGDMKHPFNIIGSGFCIDTSGVVITCRHVVSAFMSKPIEQQIDEIPATTPKEGLQELGEVGIQRPYAIFYGTGRTPDELVAVPVFVDFIMAKTDYDLGMVRLRPHPAFSKGFPYLEIENHGQIAEGDEIGTCGFPLGQYLHKQLGTITSSFTKGIVSSIIPTAQAPLEYLRGYQLNLTATFGNSGGPVYSIKSGKVFGVLQGGVYGADDNILPGIVRAEPVYPILAGDSVSRLKQAPRF